MNWLEKAFGASPDGGNGMTELMLALAVGLVLAAAVAGGLRIRRLQRVKGGR